MALNIKDPETDTLVRELVALTGEKITDAVKTAVRQRLEVEQRRRSTDREARMARVRAIVAEYQALPVKDPDFTEDSLYDENGLPI